MLASETLIIDTLTIDEEEILQPVSDSLLQGTHLKMNIIVLLLHSPTNS